MSLSKSSHRRCSVKKVFLEIFPHLFPQSSSGGCFLLSLCTCLGYLRNQARYCSFYNCQNLLSAFHLRQILKDPERCSVRELLLKTSQNLQEKFSVGDFFLLSFSEKGTPAFSCEFCKIFKNTFFTKQLRWLLFNFNKLSLRDSFFSYNKIVFTQR